MKVVVLSIRAKFSNVNHLPCADVEEMMTERGQRELQLLVNPSVSCHVLCASLLLAFGSYTRVLQ